MEAKDVLEKRVWTTKQVALAVAFAVSVTFSVTIIWSRFLYVETNVTNLENTFNLELDILTKRMDKREERNSADRKALWAEINKLKEPNSDQK